MTKIKIKVENSVPSQQKSAFSVKWSSKILQKEGVRNVAEYGCGRLRNLPVLLKYFDTVDLIETTNQYDRFKELVPKRNNLRFFPEKEFLKINSKYEAIFMISFLHVIPENKKRKQILKTSFERLKPGGYLVVDVPQSETYYNRRKHLMIPHKDGWALKWGPAYTFYKSYYAKDLDSLVEKTTGMTLFQKADYSKHLIRIWKK